MAFVNVNSTSKIEIKQAKSIEVQQVTSQINSQLQVLARAFNLATITTPQKRTCKYTQKFTRQSDFNFF
jgi:hypothetical protein